MIGEFMLDRQAGFLGQYLTDQVQWGLGYLLLLLLLLLLCAVGFRVHQARAPTHALFYFCFC